MPADGDGAAAAAAALPALDHGAASAFEEIPVVDMAPFVAWWRASGGRGELDGPARATVTAVGEACRTVGFMVCANSGVPPATMDAAMTAAKGFFAAPAAHKATASNTGDRCYRGYEAIGGDKEAWEMGRELPAGQPLPLHGPNRWPSPEHDGEGFRSAMEAYYTEAVRFARCLLGAVCAALELPADAMQAETDAALAHLRLWRYQQGAAEAGLPEHTDHGFLTLLLQDGGGGLQARNLAGGWM